MKTKITSIFIAGLFILAFTALEVQTSPLAAQPGKWVKLGSRKVNYTLDHDIIHAGIKEGGFTKLRIVVTGGSLNMHKMVVVYGNGTRDEIPLRHTFTKRSASRVIDLRGGKRIIRDISFWYDTKGVVGRRATVTVFARK